MKIGPLFIDVESFTQGDRLDQDFFFRNTQDAGCNALLLAAVYASISSFCRGGGGIYDTNQVGDEAPLEAASEMLGCNKHHLRNALLTRNLAAGGEGGSGFVSNGGSRRTRGGLETLTVPLSKAQAFRARDKLAQEVRLSLFCVFSLRCALVLLVKDLLACVINRRRNGQHSVLRRTQ